MITSELLDQWQSGLADGSIVPYLGPGALADVTSQADGRAMPATGDQLILEAAIDRQKAGIYRYKTRATVEGQLVVEADLMCTMRKAV